MKAVPLEKPSDELAFSPSRLVRRNRLFNIGAF
jgi:hypothetical protein